MPRRNKRTAVDRSATARNSRTPDRPEPAPIKESNRSYTTFNNISIISWPEETWSN
jgi:hypothetical protein